MIGTSPPKQNEALSVTLSAKIVATAELLSDVGDLYAAGADYVTVTRINKNLELAAALAAELGATYLHGDVGDKTQVATVALAARFHTLLPVVAGTTIGMLCADVPVVLLGERISKKIPIRTIRVVAALVFLSLGIFTIVKF